MGAEVNQSEVVTHSDDSVELEIAEMPIVQYRNPIPVVVLLVPVCTNSPDQFGLLTVRRSIDPKKGELALPGGYLEYEDWRAGALRELEEETGVKLRDLNTLRVFWVESVEAGKKLLVYGITDPINIKELKNYQANEEVEELVVIYQATRLAFSSHSEQVERFFERIS